MTDEARPTVVSNTGPLISMFQSDSFTLVTNLFGVIHTSETWGAELNQHGWKEALTQAGVNLVSHKLTDVEKEQANEFAQRIAAHPATKERDPSKHLGEAEAIVLAQRKEFTGAVLLLDELAPRAVVAEAGLTISGFAGVLLLAVEAGLVTPDEVKERLERCRQQGTH